MPIFAGGHRCTNILVHPVPILFAHQCPLRQYYSLTNAPCANTIRSPMPPAPILFAHQCPLR